jgi:EmrB/QacA subfamily drug resistance transporter
MAVQSHQRAPLPDQTIAEAPAFSKREITSIITGLMLALALASLDQTIVATSLSTMARDLDGWALMPWVVSAYLVTSTTTTPIYGRLSDLYGRRPVLLFAIGLFVATSVLCALAQTMPQLIVARLLQGIGGGGLRTVSQAVIADIVPPRERGRYQGYLSGMFAVSTTLGPVLGGFFAEYLSWHWIFWINLPLGGLAFALSNHNLKRLRRPSRKPEIDWLGAALILASSTPILLGIGRVEQSGGWATLGVALPIALGLLGVVALIWRETVAAEPMLPMRLFANPIFAVACAVSALSSLVMISMIVLVPIDYRLVGQLSANEAGARLIPLTAGTALGAFIAGQLVSRTGRYRIFPIIGASAMTLACIALAIVGLGHSLRTDIPLTAILGMSFGFQFSPMPVIVQNALDPSDTGIGLSTMMFSRLMGGAFGVALLSTVLIASLGAGAASVPGHEVLGDNPGVALLHLDEQIGRMTPSLLAALDGTIRRAFTELFIVTAGIGFLTLIGTISLKETALRTRVTRGGS